MIFVTNKNDFEHQDRFDGIDYFFVPGEKVALPEEAAAHMFGFGRSDKTENLIRLGWNLKQEDGKVTDDTDAGVSKLRKFVFTSAQIIEVSDNEVK
jgi:hypothetical protein